MDFVFSEEQEMLRAQARSFLADRFPPERVAQLAGDAARRGQAEVGLDAATWQEIAGLGWIGLSSSESAGGAGMSFLDEVVLLEELARSLYPGPYFSTLLALPALEHDPASLARVAAGESAASVAWDADRTVHATGDGDAWRLAGEARVADALSVDLVIVPASSERGVAIFLVDLSTGSLDVSPLSTMDVTRTYGRLAVDGTRATLLASGEDSAALLHSMRLRALAAAAVEAVGVGEQVLRFAQVYVSERTQFERPIGSYQAVSHQVADTYLGVELARSLAYWAAWCVAEADPQAATAAAAARSLAGEVAVAACERSIQVHGGIGFTWEHALHRYYKRAQWLDAFMGAGSSHRAEVATAILG